MQITMRDLFEADMEATESDYQAQMKAEGEQFEAIKEGHEKKMTLLAEQRDRAIARHKERYGIVDGNVKQVAVMSPMPPLSMS